MFLCLIGKNSLFLVRSEKKKFAEGKKPYPPPVSSGPPPKERTWEYAQERTGNDQRFFFHEVNFQLEKDVLLNTYKSAPSSD